MPGRRHAGGFVSKDVQCYTLSEEYVCHCVVRKSGIDVFSRIYDECSDNSCRSHRASDPAQNRIQCSISDNIRGVCIGKWCNIIEPLCIFCNVCDDIQKIEDCSKPQPDSDPASAQEGREEETDSGDLNLKEKISCVE